MTYRSKPPGRCVACSQDCSATFVCTVCRIEFNVCWHLVGGFERVGKDETICEECRNRIVKEELARCATMEPFCNNVVSMKGGHYALAHVSEETRQVG